MSSSRRCIKKQKQKEKGPFPETKKKSVIKVYVKFVMIYLLFDEHFYINSKNTAVGVIGSSIMKSGLLS